jgi:hypothetical protein
VLCMRAGDMGYYPRYESSLTGAMLDAPKELRVFFGGLKSVLTARSSKLTGSKGAYWLDRDLERRVLSLRLGEDAIELQSAA